MDSQHFSTHSRRKNHAHIGTRLLAFGNDTVEFASFVQCQFISFERYRISDS